MFTVARRNLTAHKFRALALVFTIVLGVSFVVGTYVLTDTITKVFNDIFTDVYSGIDVNVRHASGLGLDAVRPPVPQTLLDQVRAVEGVRVAEGNVFVMGVDIIDHDGHRVGNPQAPTFGTTWAEEDALTPFTLREGRRPTQSNEVAIDATSFDSGGFSLGDRVQLITSSGSRRFEIVGVAGFGRASNLAGATISIFDLRTAQELLGRSGQYDSINVAAATGTDAELLQERIADVLPPEYEAVTSDQLSSESSQSISTSLGFFRTFMLVFAFVALFVGAFIVYNTYSIVIYERTRELALLRALGASGFVVLGSVVIEAVLTGVLASALGLGAGVLIAAGLRRLLDVLGFSMPSGDLVLLPRTILVALIGGTLITVLASVVPAIRASRVAPIKALNEGTASQTKFAVRTAIGGATAVVGIAAMFVALDRGLLPLLGLGTVAVFIGTSMLTPLVSRPVVAAVGAPIERARGITGMLARQNARRTPRRTGTTASALMIGTALMAASFVLSASITESVDRAVTGSAVADLVISRSGTQLGFSGSLADSLEQRADVSSVARYRVAKFRIGNATKQLVGLPASSIDPSSPDLGLDIGVDRGDIARLTAGAIAVQADVAHSHHWQIGDTVSATMPDGTHELPLVATYDKNTLVGDYVVDLTTFQSAYADTSDFIVLVNLVYDADLKAVQRSIKSLIDSSYPGLKVEDRAEYVASTKAQVRQFTNLVSALLVLAIVIALIGVLITMLLSVSERTHELGLLRAVGMTRRQTRSTVRWEAAIVAFYGALLGLGLGVFFGLALVHALSKQGLTVPVVPIQPLVVLAIVISMLGVLASVYPARRAARLNVISAVSHH